MIYNCLQVWFISFMSQTVNILFCIPHLSGFILPPVLHVTVDFHWSKSHYCSGVNKSSFKSLTTCLKWLLKTWKHFSGAVNFLANLFYFLFFSSQGSSPSFREHTSKQMLGRLSLCSCCSGYNAEVLLNPVLFIRQVLTVLAMQQCAALLASIFW